MLTGVRAIAYAKSWVQGVPRRGMWSTLPGCRDDRQSWR